MRTTDLKKTTKDFQPDFIGTRHVIVYGASVYGEIAFRLMECAHIKPDYYCDRAAKNNEFMGIPVIRPEDLYEHRDDWIIIASADFFHEIRRILSDMGCENIADMEWMFEHFTPDVRKFSKRAKGIYESRKNYLDVIWQSQDEDALNFTRVQYVVTEKCSLRCRDCYHLMPYYSHPMNCEIDESRNAFERLLRVADSVSEIRILGGEPFMNREMYKVIKWWHEKEQINEFRVYTNGTIIPDNTTLKFLTYPKVSVHISDYEVNRKQIQKIEDCFKQNNIKYYVSPYEGWSDAGDLRYRNHSENENKNIFMRCHSRNCITFIDGQIHRCPRSAHAMRLHAMPDVPADYVDVGRFTGTDAELKSTIRALLEKEWIEACNFCDGTDFNNPQIPAAIQTDRVLSFS